MIGKLRWPDKHFSRIRRIWGIDSVHSPVGRPYTCSFRQHRKKAFAFLISKPTFILGILGLYSSRNHLSIGSPKISGNAFQPDTASRKSDVCNPSRLYVGKMSCPISIFPAVLGARFSPAKVSKRPECLVILPNTLRERKALPKTETAVFRDAQPKNPLDFPQTSLYNRIKQARR